PLPPEPPRKAAPSDRPVEASPAAQLVDLGQTWQEILSLVQPYSTQIMLRQQCNLLSFSGKEARIGTRSQPLFKMAKDRLPNVEAAFAAYFNHPVKVSLEVIAAESMPTTVSESPSAYPSTNAAPAAPSASPSPPFQTPHNGSSNASPMPIASAPRPTPGPARESMQPTVSTDVERSPAIPMGWQDEDEVVRAAKSLAQMFNGQIVSMEDPVVIDPNAAEFVADPSEAEAGEDSADDVPF
uniref:hypothetical protein n=1 Tax=Oculatella sp. LEGE 06141 TaxID=1828648 RepID=UPI0019DAF0D9|nr:DNA polymerase III subunit gamma/tau [Oculatella sp. LEGE 06141]